MSRTLHTARDPTYQDPNEPAHFAPEGVGVSNWVPQALDRVEVLHHLSKTKMQWYCGTVRELRADRQMYVLFDDGDEGWCPYFMEARPCEHLVLRPRLVTTPKVGDKVDVREDSGEGVRWYCGEVVQVKSLKARVKFLARKAQTWIPHGDLRLCVTNAGHQPTAAPITG